MKVLDPFLRLGYFLDYTNEKYQLNLKDLLTNKFLEFDENELIDYGVDLWNSAIGKRFRLNEKHLVPISGGLDSRFIISELLKFTESKNIYTYTFGTPGSLDYNIGNEIAKKLGTNHISYDLTKEKYSLEQLLDISKRIHHQTILFHHWPVWKLDQKFEGFNIWSGFMGDPLAGSKLSASPSVDIEEAKKRFILKNTYTKTVSIGSNDIINDLIDVDLFYSNNFSIDEQIDFSNRQLKFIAPHVLMDGYKFITPFLDKEWMIFMINLPKKLRLNKYLYHKILLRSNYKLFSHRTKSYYGLPLTASEFSIKINLRKRKLLKKLGLGLDLGVNYTNYSKLFLKDKYFQNLIISNIDDFLKRKIIDESFVKSCLNSVTKGNSDLINLILIFVSLEIHLKSGLQIKSH